MTDHVRPGGMAGLRWDFRHGWYGLLLILAVHQSVVAVTVAVDAWIAQDRVLPILWPHLHPLLFAAAAFGTFHVRVTWTRARAKLAHGLMLGAYGIRAVALIIAAEQNQDWTTSTVVSVATWLTLATAAHIGWSKERQTGR